MSGTFISDIFSPMTWDNSGNVTAFGTIAPEDQILHTVARKMRAHSVLAEIYAAERINAAFALTGIDLEIFPALLVTLSLGLFANAPTNLDTNDLEVFVTSIRENVGESQPANDGDPTDATVMALVRQVLSSDLKLIVSFKPGAGPPVTFGLADMSHGGATITYPPVQTQKGQVVVATTQRWAYQLRVDAQSGKLENVLAAGG